jgi:hypothetical protein
MQLTKGVLLSLLLEQVAAVGVVRPACGSTTVQVQVEVMTMRVRTDDAKKRSCNLFLMKGS